MTTYNIIIPLEELPRRLRDAMRYREAGAHKVARETGLSTSTISRIQNSKTKRVVSVKNLISLSRWVNCNHEKVQQSLAEFPPNPNDALIGVVRAISVDPNLNTAQTVALIDLMGVAYNRFRNLQ